MAGISLSRFAQYGAKKTEANRLAKEYKKQQKKAGQRGFFSGLLGSGLGSILGKGLLTALKIGSGGILAPLIMAGSNMLARKGAHELTRSMAADPTKLASKSEYGYGKEEAKTLREGLEEQVDASDPWSQQGGFGKELFSQYLTAGLSGDLGGVKGALKKGGGGAEQLFGVGKYGSKATGTFGERFLSGAGEGISDIFGGESVATEPTSDVDKLLTTDELSKSTIDPTTGDFMSTSESLGQDTLVPQDQLSNVNVQEPYVFGSETEENIGPLSPSWTGEQGGIVPSSPQTIADYFGNQGVSLGGSHKKSVAEMLGRR